MASTCKVFPFCSFRAAFKGLSLFVLFSTAFKGLSLFALLSEKLSTVVRYCFSNCEQCKRNRTPSSFLRSFLPSFLVSFFPSFFLSSFLFSFSLTIYIYWGFNQNTISLWSWIYTTRDSLKLRFERVHLTRFAPAFPDTRSGQSTPKVRPSLLYSRRNTGIYVGYNVEIC